MARLRPDDEFFLYMNGTNSAFNPSYSNCHMRPIPSPKVFWRHVRLPHAANRDDVDVLFIPFHSVPRFWTGKLVVVIHDLAFLIVPECFSKETRRYLNIVTPHALNRADHIITVSKSTNEDILRFYGEHLQEKMSVIYEAAGIEVNHTMNGRVERSLARWNLKNCDYFLAVGTHPIKNLKGILAGLRIVKKQFGVETKLVVVGKPTPQISHMLTNLGMESDTMFLNSISAEELQILYSNAIVLLFPSHYEGFGLPLVEAMACGCPVITSNVSSMPEIAGDAGILVDIDEPGEIAHAAYSVLSKRKLRQNLSEAALNRSQLFSWEKAARETLAVFEQVVK